MSESGAGLLSDADREALVEFRDSLADHTADLESEIATLRREPQDRGTVAALFRTLHTIKGDASLCRFELGVRIVHPIETVLGRLREGELAFTPLLAEAILLATDRLALAVAALTSGRPLDALQMDVLLDGLDRLSAGGGPVLDAGAIELIEAVTGFRPAAGAAIAATGAAGKESDRAGDLEFFHTLALQLDDRSPHFKGRSGRLLRLALAANSVAGRPVDPSQLEAAVYLHDIGMMFLRDAVWLKRDPMSEADRVQLRRHPDFAAGLAARMAGWEGAATMIAQHHETVSGGGYPLGLREKQIVPGAKILAIVDAYESVTLKQSQRGASSSLLRAAAEINACDTQFSAEWIGHFNQAIRGMIEK